jgi:hypothetical protein
LSSTFTGRARVLQKREASATGLATQQAQSGKDQMSEPGGSGRASRRLRDDSSMSFAGIRRENYGFLQRDASRGDGTAHGTGDANRGLISPTQVRQSTNTPSARSRIDILGQRFNSLQLREFKLARQRSLGQAVDPAAFQLSINLI